MGGLPKLLNIDGLNFYLDPSLREGEIFVYDKSHLLIIRNKDTNERSIVYDPTGKLREKLAHENNK